MGIYYSGYRRAKSEVDRMDRPQLLALCADLYGLDNCDRDLSDDRELRAEALFQLELAWLMPPEHWCYYPDAE